MAFEAFIAREPIVEDYWRGIILFGRNSASYKFALAKALLDLKPQSGQLVKLDELAPHFAKHVAEHLQLADKQGTSSSSPLLNSCRKFNAGELNEQQLHSETVRNGFKNVIDAFHVVNDGDIPARFFIDDRKQHNGITITDEFSILTESKQVNALYGEVEARWRLVETAWELGIGRGLVCIEHDIESNGLFSVDRAMRRKAVTSCRSALNGYQKGKCFYCFANIMEIENFGDTDVDHFFPHSLKQAGFGSVVDGVWNLVLACPECNRGANGKFAKIPTLRLLERLSTRNEFLILSHHPLRETLILQTGKTLQQRRQFLNDTYQRAWTSFIHRWEAIEVSPAAF